MKSITRKHVGIFLIFAALATGAVLKLAGVPLISTKDFHVLKGAHDGTFTVVGDEKLHWPLLVVFAVVVLGLFLTRERRPPRLKSPN